MKAVDWAVRSGELDSARADLAFLLKLPAGRKDWQDIIEVAKERHEPLVEAALKHADKVVLKMVRAVFWQCKKLLIVLLVIGAARERHATMSEAALEHADEVVLEMVCNVLVLAIRRVVDYPSDNRS